MQTPFLHDFTDGGLLLFTTLIIVIVVYLLSTSPQMLASVKSLDAGQLKNSLIASGTFGIIFALVGLAAGALAVHEWATNRSVSRFMGAITDMPNYINNQVRNVTGVDMKNAVSPSASQPRRDETEIPQVPGA